MADERSITQRLQSALVERRLLTEDQLEHAREAHKESGEPLGELLVLRGLITPAAVREVLEDELGVPALDLSSYAPEPAALRLVPADVARTSRILPLFEIEGMLTVAVANPLDVFSFDELSVELAYEIEPVLCDGQAVVEAIEANYPGNGETAVKAAAEAPASEGAAPAGAPAPAAPPAEVAGGEPAGETAPAPEAGAAEGGPSPEEAAALDAEIDEALGLTVPGEPAQTSWGKFDLDILAVADNTNVVMLVTDILTQARDAGASHVHVDPRPEDFEIVFKVGSERRHMAGTQVGLLPALLKVVRSMTHLDPQPRRPATGRLRLMVHDREENIGVSMIPTLFGERLVFSLPQGFDGPSHLDDLGMTPEQVAPLKLAMSEAHGLILVVGPVHSGRSTAYGALLAASADANHAVLSIEDRAEHEMTSIWQVELLPASGLTLDEAIACGVRQDVDVIGVDELRQPEELGVLLDAVADGTGAVATMTAKDPAAAITRLIGAGVEPQSLSKALRVVVTARLVEKNCPHCREGYSSKLAGEAGLGADDSPSKGVGCEACGGTGVEGMCGLFEVVVLDEAMRGAVAAGRGQDQLREALASASPTMVEGARALIAAGEVTVEAADAVIPLRKG
jgi:type II secretory ATPase GspE/PulE/Tfp pilus assembly ATPase PilB-like protein